MLRTTAATLNESLFTGRDNIGIGKVQVVGVAREQQTGSSVTMLTVPPGQVFLITKIVVQSDATANAAGFTGSPNPPRPTSSFGITMNDTAGTAKFITSFQNFFRWQQTFEFQDSPNWRNAPPGNVTVWTPKYAIPVPPGWTVRSSQTLGAFGNQASVYGVMVSADGARTLGYSVGNSTTATDLNYGVQSNSPTSAPTTIISGRTGKCIRLLDVLVQMQPETQGTNLLTIQQVDGRAIFRIANNNPADLLDLRFSPDGIFLKSGQGLQTSVTKATSAIVDIAYEYVNDNEVPGDAWWSCVIPDQPTPALPTSGTFGNVVTASTQVTCYYPRLDSLGITATKTSPTKGYQHLLNGYLMSLQKDTSTTPEQLSLNLSTGSAAGGVLNSALGTTGPGVQISPTFVAAGHDQCVYAAIDGINFPGKQDDGSLWVNSSNILGAITTPTSGTAQIDNWAFTLWGRTIPNRFTDPANLGS